MENITKESPLILVKEETSDKNVVKSKEEFIEWTKTKKNEELIRKLCTEIYLRNYAIAAVLSIIIPVFLLLGRFIHKLFFVLSIIFLIYWLYLFIYNKGYHMSRREFLCLLLMDVIDYVESPERKKILSSLFFASMFLDRHRSKDMIHSRILKFLIDLYRPLAKFRVKHLFFKFMPELKIKGLLFR